MAMMTMMGFIKAIKVIKIKVTNEQVREFWSQ